MYNKPETETISVEMTTTLCASGDQTQPVGFGGGAGTGPALAPGRGEKTEIF